MNILEKAQGLGETLLAAGQGMLSGKPLFAPDLMVQNRLAICKACPHHGEIFCAACGCITEAKVRLAASHCPQGKWRSL